MDNMRLGKGLFATHLFDGEPLGQTDDKAPIPYAPPVTSGSTGTAPKAPALLPSAPKAPAYTTEGGYPTTPAYDPSMYATGQSSMDWTPVLMIGGGSLLAVGFFALLFGGKKKAASPTPNRRRKRRRH